jgi:hypothetical protein
MTWRGEQAAGITSRAGNPSRGYYAGYGPQAGGSGSGMGQAMAGRGQFASGQGITVAGSDWHPTILYLLALIVAEMFVFGLIAHHLK